MELIGENIHIISKKTRTAIEEKNSNYIQTLALKQKEAGMTYIDLNIGPARRQEGVMEWLINTVQEVTDLPLSLDTTNFTELESGLKILHKKQKPLINSTSGDLERLEKMLPFVSDYDANIIALTMNESGIPGDPEGKLEIAMTILEKTAELGIENDRIYIDPLVLPVSVRQDQCIETLNSIRVFKESFDPPVHTVIGLSNISNGSPKEKRSLINRVYMVLAMGCGLDTAIVDAFDEELREFINVIENKQIKNERDQLIFNLFTMMQEFEDLEDISYNKSDTEQTTIYKTAEILLQKNIYAHNYI